LLGQRSPWLGIAGALRRRKGTVPPQEVESNILAVFTTARTYVNAMTTGGLNLLASSGQEQRIVTGFSGAGLG
jgi:hypothetical protein